MLSLILYYCMTNLQSEAVKAFVSRTLVEDAPMVLRLHGDSLLNIVDFAANNEAHDILTQLLLNQMPDRNVEGEEMHAELHRVFTRRDNAKTFQQRVVVELDEPGRIREISDSELPMAHVLTAAKALVANDGVGCSREYDAALAEAEKVPREKTNNPPRRIHPASARVLPYHLTLGQHKPHHLSASIATIAATAPALHRSSDRRRLSPPQA